MKKISVLMTVGTLALAGCGDDGDSGDSERPNADAATKKGEHSARPKEDQSKPPSRKGATITVGKSQFGPMLFDSKKQAIYGFENDRNRQTVCYGDCAEAWPPVLIEGKPRARGGARQSLLGTLRRRDGSRQVTYAGKPLYLYAHEGPGEIRCHNVDLNGGLWWVIGPDGKQRP